MRHWIRLYSLSKSTSQVLPPLPKKLNTWRNPGTMSTMETRRQRSWNNYENFRSFGVTVRYDRPKSFSLVTSSRRRQVDCVPSKVYSILAKKWIGNSVQPWENLECILMIRYTYIISEHLNYATRKLLSKAKDLKLYGYTNRTIDCDCKVLVRRNFCPKYSNCECRTGGFIGSGGKSSWIHRSWSAKRQY